MVRRPVAELVTSTTAAEGTRVSAQSWLRTSSSNGAPWYRRTSTQQGRFFSRAPVGISCRRSRFSGEKDESGVKVNDCTEAVKRAQSA